jgi:hypothetical protein
MLAQLTPAALDARGRRRDKKKTSITGEAGPGRSAEMKRRVAKWKKKK